MKIIYKLAMLLGAVGLMLTAWCGCEKTFTVNGVSFEMSP